MRIHHPEHEENSFVRDIERELFSVDSDPARICDLIYELTGHSLTAEPKQGRVYTLSTIGKEKYLLFLAAELEAEVMRIKANGDDNRDIRMYEDAMLDARRAYKEVFESKSDAIHHIRTQHRIDIGNVFNQEGDTYRDGQKRRHA